VVTAEPINLFWPFVPESAVEAVTNVLRGRWVGQGPLVDRFEAAFADLLGVGWSTVAVGSGTDALHLAYILAGVTPGSEVVAPVFTCAATNMPLLYLGARVRFADIQPGTLNIDPAHVRELVNEHTRAIVCVHYGGLPCEMDELLAIGEAHGIPVIEDAAQAFGAMYRGRRIGSISPFTAFSFQAIKHVTTGDGGLLSLRDANAAETARRLRWFGIDRAAKAAERWDGNIREVGYKYQMTDIAAAMGLAGLAALPSSLAHRRKLYAAYAERLRGVASLQVVGDALPADREHAACLFTILVDDAASLRAKLCEHGIESSPVHYRNDRYDVFASSRSFFPNMDAVDGRYLCLPLHSRVTLDDVERICEVIRS
jgi:dTDP-4-amino-4,6-dideoxygalactose transaminase